MPISFNRKTIGEGIALTEITDQRFKSNYISICFITPVDAVTAPLNGLVVDMLACANRKLPTLADVSKELGRLYGAVLATRSRRVGDNHENGLTIEYISDDFTMNKEVISDRTVGILLDCLFDPLLENGEFVQKYVNMRKNELEDSILAELNDKFGYSARRAKEIIYKGEPAAVSLLGTVENARSITSGMLTRRYEELKSTARIEAVMCGRGFDGVREQIVSRLSELKRSQIVPVTFRRPSPLKPETARKNETLDVNQSKMVMAFKSDFEDLYVAKLFAAVLGGTPTSKLFANVREKMSLCYYCSASYADFKGTLVVSSGVDKDNIAKAEKAILDQLESVRNGEFTDQELLNAKIYLCTGFKSNNDSIYRMAEYYNFQNMRGSAYSPEQICELFMKITREQVIECAASFKYDTIYVLEPETEVQDDG